MDIDKDKYTDDIKNTLQCINNMKVSISNLFFVWCGIENLLTKIFSDTRSNFKIKELVRKNGNNKACDGKIDSYKIFEIIFFLEENNILSNDYISKKLSKKEENLIFRSPEINQIDTTKLKDGIIDIVIINQFREFRNQHLGHTISNFEINSKLSKIAMVYKKISIEFINWVAEEYINNDTWYNNIKKDILPFSSDIEHFINDIRNEEKDIAQAIIKDTVLKIKCPSGLEILDESYFQNCIITDEKQLNSDKIAFYTRFNVPETKMGMVVANNFHITPKFPIHLTCEDEYDKTAISIDDFENDILANIELSPVLYKILSVGGVGKSTFMWHIANLYHNKYATYYIKNHDVNSIKYIFECIKPNKQIPIIIIMDEFTRSDLTSSIIEFSQAITNPHLTKDYKIILIVAEREIRFKKIDNDFYDGYKKIYTHVYSNDNIKDDIFNEVIKLSQGVINIDDIDKKIYYESKSIFNKISSISLVDRIFATLRYLKNKNFLDIRFKFDWEDWKDYCSHLNKSDYEDIFKQVAFFYQFGVEVPINYICKFIFGDNISEREFDKRLDSLVDFFEKLPINSSINHTKSQSGNTNFLKLRHEKIGQWYFEFEDNSGNGQKRLFNTFIKYIDDASSFYLFKNLIRNNSEFENSSLYNELDKKNILLIIDNYINKVTYIDEKVKGLMEKHFYNYSIGDYTSSLSDLKEIIKLKDLISKAAVSYLTTAYLRYAILIEENRIHIDEESESSSNELIEQIYLKILDYDNTNIRALLKLYNIYYNFQHNIDAFQLIHKKLHWMITSDVSLAYGWINFIKTNFNTLPDIVIATLSEISKIDIRLSIEISNLFEKYKLYKASHEVLITLIDNVGKINVKTSSFFAGQVANIILDRINKAKNNNVEREYLIKKADLLITDIYQHKVTFKSEVLKAKLSFLKHEFDGDYESLLYYLFDKDKTKQVSMNLIHSYYDSNINKYLGNRRTDYDKLGVYVNNYTNFIIINYDKVSLIPNSQRVKDYLEYLRITNRTIEKISDNSKILALHGISEKLFKKVENFLEKDNTIITEDYYSYLYSKFATIYFFHYKTLYHKRTLSELDFPKELTLKEISNSKLILEKAFLKDNQNTILYLYLLNCYLLLNTDIELLLKNNIIFLLSNDQKAEFLKILWLNRNANEYAITFTEKLGFINSTKLKTKNNLTFSYIKAGLWKYALNTLDIKLISEDEFIKSKELRTNIRELADQIIVEKNRKDPLVFVKAKLDLSNFYLNFINKSISDSTFTDHKIYTDYDLDINVYNKFKMLFLLGDIKDAFDYYDNFSQIIIKTHIYKYNLKEDSVLTKQVISKYWFEEYINCHTFKIINEVRYSKDYNYLISESTIAILNLLKLKIHSKKIVRSENNNKYYKQAYYEKYNSSLKLIFNNFLYLYNPNYKNKKSHRRINTERLYDFCNSLLEKNNILIDKCILSTFIGLVLDEKYNIILDQKNIIIKTLIKRYENSDDTEIFRMIGRYLLSINSFVNSQKFTEKALKLARNQNKSLQEAYCLNNLSDFNLSYAKHEILTINVNEYEINRIYERLKNALSAFNKAQLLIQRSDEIDSDKIQNNREKFHKNYMEAINILILTSLNYMINIDQKRFNKTPGIFIKLNELLKIIKNEYTEFSKFNNFDVQDNLNNINKISNLLYKTRIKPFFDSKKK